MSLRARIVHAKPEPIETAEVINAADFVQPSELVDSALERELTVVRARSALRAVAEMQRIFSAQLDPADRGGFDVESQSRSASIVGAP